MLLSVVFVLLLGITALLGVAYNRHQRLEDVTTDLQRNLTQQESKIMELEERLEDCDTLQAAAPVDHSWDVQPASARSGKTRAQVSFVHRYLVDTTELSSNHLEAPPVFPAGSAGIPAS